MIMYPLFIRAFGPMTRDTGTWIKRDNEGAYWEFFNATGLDMEIKRGANRRIFAQTKDTLSDIEIAARTMKLRTIKDLAQVVCMHPANDGRMMPAGFDDSIAGRCYRYAAVMTCKTAPAMFAIASQPESEDPRDSMLPTSLAVHNIPDRLNTLLCLLHSKENNYRVGKTKGTTGMSQGEIAGRAKAAYDLEDLYTYREYRNLMANANDEEMDDIIQNFKGPWNQVLNAYANSLGVDGYAVLGQGILSFIMDPKKSMATELEIRFGNHKLIHTQLGTYRDILYCGTILKPYLESYLAGLHKAEIRMQIATKNLATLPTEPQPLLCCLSANHMISNTTMRYGDTKLYFKDGFRNLVALFGKNSVNYKAGARWTWEVVGTKGSNTLLKMTRFIDGSVIAITTDEDREVNAIADAVAGSNEDSDAAIAGAIQYHVVEDDAPVSIVGTDEE